MRGETLQGCDAASPGRSGCRLLASVLSSACVRHRGFSRGRVMLLWIRVFRVKLPGLARCGHPACAQHLGTPHAPRFGIYFFSSSLGAALALKSSVW